MSAQCRGTRRSARCAGVWVPRSAAGLPPCSPVVHGAVRVGGDQHAVLGPGPQLCHCSQGAMVEGGPLGGTEDAGRVPESPTRRLPARPAQGTQPGPGQWTHPGLAWPVGFGVFEFATLSGLSGRLGQLEQGLSHSGTQEVPSQQHASHGFCGGGPCRSHLLGHTGLCPLRCDRERLSV